MKRQRLLLTTAILAWPLAGQLARAADAQPAPAASTIQEVVVTAQRREQSLLAVPLSIQATTGDQLNRTGIRDLTSLQFTTPGYLPQTDSGFTQIFIRGIGNSIYVGADPSVATFVDDVPRIYGSMADTLFDVQRVEVLKGAQGGLYGRNATGGVVNIITRQPSLDAYSGDALASYGTKNTFRGALFANLPVNEKVALSVALERDSHDPYMKNIAPHDPYSAANFPNGSAFGNSRQTADFFNRDIVVPKVNDQNFWAANTKLLIKPTDNYKVTLAYDWYNKHDNNGQGIFDTTPAYSQAALAGLFGSLGITTNLPPGFLIGPTKKFTIAYGTPLSVHTRENGVSVTQGWNAPGFDLTSITAYRTQHSLYVADTLSASVGTVPVNVGARRHFFYQELRGVSTFAGPWRLLGGATYLENHQSSDTEVFLLSRAMKIAESQVRDTVKNWSIYGQAEYDITPRLKLSVSGRYIHETNKATFILPVAAGARTVEKKFIPAATLSYSLDGGTAYARWARGFKSGGINLSTAPIFYPSPSEGSVFSPETVDTYEIGWRQALFDRSVQFTSAVFYNDYKNLQVDARAKPGFPAITTAIINANSARTYGAEAGVTWRVAQPLTVGFNAGYLNARYKDFKLQNAVALADFDRSKMQMPKAPKWQLSFNGNLDQPINDKFRLVSTVLASYSSRVIWMYSAVPGVLPNNATPGYWLVNLRVGVRTTDDKYGAAIVADNLFNKAHYSEGNVFSLGNALGYADPRIIRGEITAKF